jgi:predicted MFS family arabinose efflux permease
MKRATSRKTAADKLPGVVLVLAAGTFLMGTTEFMVAGLLPEMSASLGVSESRTGLLITAFAVGMIVGAPSMAALTLRLPRSLTLKAALVLFAVGHVIVATNSNFTVVLAARVLTALATGAFWAVAAVIATAAVGPHLRARALGALIGGLTLANIVGVPIGSFVGHAIGWRGPFWALAGLSLIAAGLIGRFLPAEGQRATPSLRREIRALRDARIWLALAASATIMGGVLATYTYVSPLLRGAGISAAWVPLVLVGFGVGAMLGTTTGGRFGDRRPIATTVTAATGTAIVLVVLALFSRNAVAAAALIVLMGWFGFTVNPVVTALAVKYAGDSPTMASALSTSAFNAGIALSSWVAGLTIDTSLGLKGPPIVGAVIAALTLLPLAGLARRLRTPSSRPTNPDALSTTHPGEAVEAHQQTLPVPSWSPP